MNYYVSLSGMSAAQKGIQVTQHNIANLNTEGYARQRLELKEVGVASGSGVMQKNGTGVFPEDVAMITDQILLNNYNGQNSKVGYYENLEDVLMELETIYGDYTQGSLNNLTTKFFESWDELSKFPEETSYKSALLGEATRLTNKINELGNEFSRILQDTKDKVRRQMEEINVLTESLARINMKFNEMGENAPNALRNERNKIIEQLSRFVDVEVSYEHSNKDLVTIRTGGVLLVDGEKMYDMKWLQSDSESFLTNGSSRVDLQSGALKANLDLVYHYIGGYQNQLETFVTELINRVNAYHASGFSITGDTGLNFFEGYDAKSIQINSDLLDAPVRVATSSELGVAGNTEVAKQIANVFNEEITPGVNFRNHINTLTMDMSQALHDTKTQMGIQQEVLDGMNQQKENVQGVNLEEEMTYLMMYQRFFGANAKAIKILDDMYNMVFQMV